METIYTAVVFLASSVLFALIAFFCFYVLLVTIYTFYQFVILFFKK